MKQVFIREGLQFASFLLFFKTKKKLIAKKKTSSSDVWCFCWQKKILDCQESLLQRNFIIQLQVNLFYISLIKG